MKNLTLDRLRLLILTNERSNKNRSIDSARKLINLIGLTEIPNDKCKQHVTRSLVNFQFDPTIAFVCQQRCMI